MATIPGVFQAGAWAFTAITLAMFVAGIIIQQIQENQRWKSSDSRIVKTFLGRPTTLANILNVGALACAVKAIAYWTQFYGVAIGAAPNYWGTYLGWVLFLFFVGHALAIYLCMRTGWHLVSPWLLALVAGTLLAASFVPIANQLAFVLISVGLMLVALIQIGLFRIRMDWQSLVAIILLAVVYAGGYFVPYVLSPRYQITISNLASLIWYLIADFVVAAWFVFLAATALECSAVEKKVEAMRAGLVCKKQ